MSSPRYSSSSALVLISAVTFGCGSLRPLVDIEAKNPPTPPGIALNVSEGRPTSVILSVSWTDPPEFTHLELIRADTMSEPTVLHTLESGPQIRAQLQKGVLISDPTIPQTTVVYAVVAYSGESRISWDEIVFDWNAPTPATSVGFEVLAGAVVLAWTQIPGQGAIIFRRDVLLGDGLKRIAELEASSDGSFVDTQVLPDGVYAYRIALMERVAFQNKQGFMKRFGTPSEEIYVTLSSATDEGSATSTDQVPLNEPANDAL